MKIAVAAQKNDENSQINDVAGRAPYYLVFEDERIVETIDNPFCMGSGGAGFGVAKMLADKNVDMVIAGKFGEKMIDAMQKRGLKYAEKQGIIIKEINKINSQT